MQSPANVPPLRAASPGQTLITAHPVVQLRDRLIERYTTLARFAPNSDAVATLRECVSELDQALVAGHDTNVFVSVDEAARLFGRPRSTISYICRTKGRLVGAKKVEGVWVIDRHAMTRYFTTEDPGEAA